MEKKIEVARVKERVEKLIREDTERKQKRSEFLQVEKMKLRSSSAQDLL